METTLAHAALYNFLAAAFGDPPTAEFMTALANMLPIAAPASLDELRRVYTRLLVGPGAGYVPPYASVYLHPFANGKPLLWGPEAVAVEAIYRQAGLDIAPGQPRVPDHLAVELQFMQHLCAREADALVRGAAVEANEWRAHRHAFLRDHLWPWLPQFAAHLTETEAHSVYRALANLAVSLVQSELDEA